MPGDSRRRSLQSNKGINLPNTRVNLPSITDKDWEDVDWAIENDLDYLALSFVREADDCNSAPRTPARQAGPSIT